ncbi:MAG: hypothetical protein IKD08_02140 [Alphaproteobacteria bacterium]|nr:hypothetical protein [Alphaproteobacteria bacterium]
MLKKVLLAEQDEDDRKLFADLLKDIGCDTIQIKDFQDVVELALTNSPDLIILSENEQEESLSKTVKTLKDNEDTRLIPILAALNNAQEKQKEALAKVGVDDFIYRPFSVVAFLNKIKEMLAE